jgi:hypothetical protein
MKVVVAGAAGAGAALKAGVPWWGALIAGAVAAASAGHVVQSPAVKLFAGKGQKADEEDPKPPRR